LHANNFLIIFDPTKPINTMRIIKIIFGGLASIIALLLIAAAVLPKKLDLKSEITVAAPIQKVADYIKILKNQEQYSVWLTDEPQTKLSYEGIDGTVGAKQMFSGGSSTGTMEITACTPDGLDVKLTMTEPFASIATTGYKYTAVDSMHTTISTWYKDESAWPMNLMSQTIGKSMIEKNDLRILQNLKGILEK
jgi:hypothetical protein